jgi:glycerate-2-kinase
MSTDPSPVRPESDRELLQMMLAEATASASQNSTTALERAANFARAQNLIVLQLGIEALADLRELTGVHAAIALQGVRNGRASAPTVILCAGPISSKGIAASATDYVRELQRAVDAHPAILVDARDVHDRGQASVLRAILLRRDF